MSEELTPQKERFLREVEQKLLRRGLDARLLEDGLIHVRWNEKPLCSVDRDGIVRFRPADIMNAENILLQRKPAKPKSKLLRKLSEMLQNRPYAFCVK